MDNVAQVVETLATGAITGVDLFVFPECILTGYVYDTQREVREAALEIDGPELALVIGACADLEVHAVVGLLERAGEDVYNSAALIGPDGLIGVYRKRHLPFTSADRFTSRSDDVDLALYDTPLGRIGIAICYEIRFPEAIRTLALGGADIVALPTAWPVESVILADLFTRVRAAENFVYLVVANHCGREREVEFLGSSQIVTPSGEVAAHAGSTVNSVTADVDVRLARDKRIVFREGEFEVSPWADRRPEAYQL
jgi:predicted amidohydrolase